MKKLLLCLTLLMTTAAFADQCSYITKAQAKKALVFALEAKRLQTLCEPCGEVDAETINVKSIGIKDVEYKGYWQLQVNGQGVDLAYTFVNGLNLSKVANCESDDVTTFLPREFDLGVQ